MHNREYKTQDLITFRLSSYYEVVCVRYCLRQVFLLDVCGFRLGLLVCNVPTRAAKTMPGIIWKLISDTGCCYSETWKGVTK